VDVLKRAWTEERFSHAGRFFTINEARVMPRPWQKPHPPLCRSFAGRERALSHNSGYRQAPAPRAPEENPMTIRLYDPTAEPRAIDAKLAPRLTSLAGKRIGILDNGKANAGTLMLAVAKVLQDRYGAGDIVKRNKPVAGPPAPEILEALSHCDLALVGSAD